MMKRADSKRLNGNGTTTAALSHGGVGGANEARHRRLPFRLKHNRGRGTSWMLVRLVFGSLGVVAMVTLCTSVANPEERRDSGPTPAAEFKEPAPPAAFRYDTGAHSSRGDTEQLQKPPAPPAPPSPPPPPPPRPPLVGEDAGGPQGEPDGAGDRGREGRRRKSFIRRKNDDRDEDPEEHAKKKKKFHRIEKGDISSEDSILKNYIRGGWMGGLGLGIDAYVGDGSWDAELSADPADGEDDVSRRRPVIINADEDGGGDMQARWEPGQLSRLAQRQQRQRDEEEEEEEEDGVARTPMLGPDAVLLIICANRPEYLERTLNAVAEHHPGSSRGASFAIPVVISQDGTSSAVEAVISRFTTSMAGRAHVTHIHHTPAPRENRPYFKLSAHYEWALSQVFDELFQNGYSSAAVDKVIILEEDLEIAPDFFEYFSAMAPLLDSDETLMAVSAWNDNGQAAHVKDNKALFRSDFFPGLGWMLPRSVWDELSADWPEAYWDDWLRDPRRRKGRQFIRPEVCRTYHFGQKAGASRNQFSQLLNNISLNEKAVPFREMDMSYLMPDAFRSWLGGVLRNARAETVANVKAGRAVSPEVVVEYGSEREFASLARQLGIMEDTKAQVPRTAYMGVVTVWVGDTKVYLAPRESMARLWRR